MAESSGWVSSPKQRSPQFEHLDSVICRSLRLSINISMGTKQQVSYLITAMMAAKIFLAPARFRHLRAASWPFFGSGPAAAGSQEASDFAATSKFIRSRRPEGPRKLSPGFSLGCLIFLTEAL
jgi:hypothetical protein